MGNERERECEGNGMWQHTSPQTHEVRFEHARENTCLIIDTPLET